MDDPTPPLVAVRNRRSILREIYIPLAALLLAAATTVLCRATAGVSLGLFFGAFAFATLLVPPLAVAEDGTGRRMLAPFLVPLGVALVWLTAIGDRLTFGQWVACVVALLAYTVALCGLVSLVAALRVNPVVAAAVVAVLGMLWLTWPVWLSHALLRPAGDALVGWLVPAHPLFAVNAVLIHFDTWDRHPLAYGRLTVLNQDVFYALPGGVVWAALLHGGVGGVTLALTARMGKRRKDLTAAPLR